MSFILDALKKSEAERQQQSAAEFAGTAAGPHRQTFPRWLLVVGILLATNLVVLVGLLIRSDESQPATQPDTSPVAQPAPTAAGTGQPEPRSDFEERVAEAKRSLPVATESKPPAVEVQQPAPQETANTNKQQATVARQPAASTRIYPSIHEARANGASDIPELHLDLHVYSAEPDDRFVFINMTKLREGSQLREGPVVAEITPDGVVLGHRGQYFTLPRE